MLQIAGVTDAAVQLAFTQVGSIMFLDTEAFPWNQNALRFWSNGTAAAPPSCLLTDRYTSPTYNRRSEPHETKRTHSLSICQPQNPLRGLGHTIRGATAVAAGDTDGGSGGDKGGDDGGNTGGGTGGDMDGALEKDITRMVSNTSRKASGMQSGYHTLAIGSTHAKKKKWIRFVK